MGTLFQVLGPVRIVSTGHEPREQSAKVRVVLATLLLQANGFVSTRRLTEALWGHDEPTHGRSTLPTYVMRLRKSLAEAGLYGVCSVETQAGGYVMRLPVDALDLAVFQDLVQAGHRAAGRGDTAGERDCLTRALNLWYGVPLSNVNSELLQRDEVPHLIEQWVHAMERRFDLDLALGCDAELIPELRRATARFPRHERFWAQLMEALYRAGRQAEALDTYHLLRRSLADELGIDPRPQLQRLYLELLNGRDEPAPAPIAVSVPPVVASLPSVDRAFDRAVDRAVDRAPAGCQLPPDIGQFVGRQELIDEIIGQLMREDRPGVSPIAAVCGGPGIGKTALAVRVAYLVRDHFPDGQLFATLQDPDGTRRCSYVVLGELLRNLGVPATEIPADPNALVASFRARLAGARVLLVLDDADDVAQVQPLLPGTLGCAVLVTSRSSMLGLTALYGSQSIRLSPLTEDQSVELMSRLLGAQRVAAEPAPARALAGLCGNQPLALRIAMAQLSGQPGRSIAEYVAELCSGDAVNELCIGRASSISVRWSIDRSYRRLSRDAGRFFQLLGLVHDAVITTGAGAALAGVAESEARALLEDLAAVNLLEPQGGQRYRLPELVGRYAREKACCELGDEVQAAGRRLLDHYLGTLANAAAVLSSRARGPATPTGPTGRTFCGPAAALAWLAAESETVAAFAQRLAKLVNEPLARALSSQLAELARLAADGDDAESRPA
jgi:DNA-binding SARP family transcriptional activator